MKFRFVLAAATSLVLPMAAHAQPVTGPYVSLEGGTTITNPLNYRYEEIANFDAGYGDTGKLQSRPSYAGADSVGYGFGDGFRVELGGDFLRNTFHAQDLNFGFDESYKIHSHLTGGENTYGPMVNGLYDFSVGLPIFPYVGAGIGYQWVKLKNDIRDEFFGLNTGGTEGSFAYQIIAGLSYPLPMVPGLSVTAEYRFMQLVESRNYDAAYRDDEEDGNFGKTKLGQQSSSIFMVGLRYQIFNPPPPPSAVAPVPMAAPAPVPAKTYLVFFDWDKSSLTPRATQVIAEAAADSKTTSVTTIQVGGYTDTSGTPVYNRGLSVRRAKAVEAQLVADGVPESEIAAHGFGDTHLLVPTGPGVREPQNRRVEIIFD